MILLIDPKPLKPTIEEVQLETVVEKALGGVSIPPTISVIISIPKDFPILRSNGAAIRRIIGNLVLNAVQAMPNGGTLSVLANQSTNKATIAISDTGVGIPEDLKPKLFKPLVTTKSKGQGFGLAVVKKLVDDLGWNISYDSQIGKGTTFKIELPTQQ